MIWKSAKCDGYEQVHEVIYYIIIIIRFIS